MTEPKPQPDCSYCSAAELSKKMGMTGENTIHGGNKDEIGESASPTCCHE